MASMSPHRRRQQASDADESDRRLGMPQSTQRLPIRRLSGYTAAKQNPLHRGSLRDSATLRLHLPTVSVQSDGGRSCSCDECDSFGDIFHSLTWLVAVASACPSPLNDCPHVDYQGTLLLSRIRCVEAHFVPQLHSAFISRRSACKVMAAEAASAMSATRLVTSRKAQGFS